MGALIHFFQVPLYRELSVVALIVLLIVAYYFRYVHFAKLTDTRTHRRWLDDLIRGTRRVLIVMVVALVGLVVYDRVVIPRQSAASTQAVRSANTKKTSVKKKSHAKAVSSSRPDKTASSSSGEIIDAAEHPLDDQQYHDLLIVQGYYKDNPNAGDNAATFRYRGQETGNAGVKVTEIGGYRKLGKNKLKLTHVYWVYPSGQFDVKR